MDKAPKPVKFMFFLLLLLVFAIMIPFILHLFGVHCDHAGDIKTTSPLSIITNVKLGLIDADEIYNRSSYIPDQIGLIDNEVPIIGVLTPDISCRLQVCVDGNGDYRYGTSSDCDNYTKRYIFLSKSWEWARCIVCDGDTNYTFVQGGLLASTTDYYCHGDATPIPDEDKSFFQSWVCKPDQRCVPPTNFYFEEDTGTYDCIDATSCGQNETENVIPLIDAELEDANAETLYSNIDEKDFRSAIMFSCTDRKQPQVTFFKIPIFDYRLWLFIMVIVVMFIFLSNIKRH